MNILPPPALLTGIHSMELKGETKMDTLHSRMGQNPFNGIESAISLPAGSYTFKVYRIHSMELKGMVNLTQPSACSLGRNPFNGIESSAWLNLTLPFTQLHRIHSMELKAGSNPADGVTPSTFESIQWN